MKKHIPLLALLCLSVFAGCSLLPKTVEFGQSKVPKFPEKTATHKELERETADLLVKKTQETEKAAIVAEAPQDVLDPAKEASELASGLSISLGPPVSPYKGPSDALVAKLEAQVAKQNKALDKLNDRLEKFEGKKIEGTGIVQVPYLVYVGVVIGGIALLIALAHSGLSIAALFNPVAAGIKGGLDLGWKGAKQLVAGGGKFLEDLENSPLAAEAKAEVKKLFVSAHKQVQDEDVKKLVSNLPGAVKL